MDNTDLKILEILIHNARESNVSIAKALKMVPSAIFQRIRKLEQNGIIQGYSIQVNREAVDLSLTSFLSLDVSPDHIPNIESALSAHPHVLEVHRTTGPSPFLIKVVAQDQTQLLNLIDTSFSVIPGVTAIHSSLVLKTASEHLQIPLSL